MKLKKTISAFCAFAMLLASVVTAHAETPAYNEYISGKESGVQSGDIITVSAENSILSENAELKSNLNNSGKTAVVINTNGSARFVFPIADGGKYGIKISYLTLENVGNTLDYTLKLDDKIPFKQCENLTLLRNWVFETGEFTEDLQGNELPPVLTEDFLEQTAMVSDSSGYYNSSFEFLFESGDRSIEITAVNGAFAITKISLVPTGKTPSYENYLKSVPGESGESSKIIEAETANYRSSKSIASYCDDTTASVSPYVTDKKVINILGGEGWSRPNQSASWKLTVAESGLYNIHLKVRQDYSGGLFINRSLLINGELPFKEADYIQIPYSVGWQDLAVGNQDGAYKFYFESGKEYTITLNCTLGVMADYIRAAQDIVIRLNEIYRRIIMTTSLNPDPYRDYLLEEKTPEIFPKIKECLEDLTTLGNDLENMIGQRSTEHVALDDLILQLNEFIKNPDDIPSELNKFQTNISNLATWINSRYKQPMDLDYIELTPVDKEASSVNAGFVQKVIFFVKSFIRSFGTAYEVTDGKSGSELEVWIPIGRDQAQIIKRLVDERFVAEYDIPVNVKMVPAGAVLPAVVAKRGPDIVLGSDNNTPVNFATRNALVDLSKLEGYSEVAKRFNPSAIVPYGYNGGVFALPGTQNFPVLFYRTDVFETLNLQPPQTWEDVYKIIAALQVNNMQFGFGGGFETLLFQNGGKYYLNDGKKSGLDSMEAHKSFAMWTALYRDYKLPLTYDFVNRFRSGEMPIAISAYTQANMLSIFAPEINGSWKMSLIPGTLMKDGTVNHIVAASGTGAYIVKECEDVDSAWKFLKWWTDASVQKDYCLQIEERLGPEMRCAPANKQVFEYIPWQKDKADIIRAQWDFTEGIPEAPGGYFTARHLTNAFRKVVYSETDPRETLNEYVGVINSEIYDKRLEFHLPTE